MTDYSKLKVDELKKLLGDRGLSLSGKKADFVSRLNEDDESKTKQLKEQQSSAEPSQKVSQEPPVSKSTEKTTDDKTKITTAPQINNDEQEAKFAARAARFGMTKDEEEEKRKARAARFGQTVSTGKPGLLEDKSLSEPKQRKNPTSEVASNAKGKAAKKGEQAAPKRSLILDDPVEAEKARKRALKFGISPAEGQTA